MAIYLEDVDFSQKETEEICGAHIAYTFDFQGGAASGYNTPLAFKSSDKPVITFEKIQKLKSLGENMDKIEKDFVQSLLSNLSDTLNAKFTDDWDWLCLVDADFDANIAVFCCDDGMFSVGFQRNDLVFTVDDVAQPVVQTTDYQIVDGDVMVSVDFFDNLVDQALAGLTKSALSQSKVVKMLIKASTEAKAKAEIEKGVTTPSAIENEPKGDPKLDIQELLKSQEAQEAQELLKAQMDAIKEEAKAEAEAIAKAAIEKAQAEVEELRKAQRSREISDTEMVVKSYSEFVEEGDVADLVKCLVDNADVASLVLKALDSAKEKLENIKKELGEEKGVSVETKPEAAIQNQNDAIKKRAEQLKAQRAAK